MVSIILTSKLTEGCKVCNKLLFFYTLQVSGPMDWKLFCCWVRPKEPKMIPKASTDGTDWTDLKEERKELKGRNDTMIHPRIEAERTENE